MNKLSFSNNPKIKELNKKLKIVIWEFSMAVFLALTIPWHVKSSDFWNYVLENSTRLGMNNSWWLCNISNISIKWENYVVTAEHCSNNFDWTFHNWDFKIWKMKNKTKFTPLSYDLNLRNTDLLWKTVQVIWKLPFNYWWRLYTINIEFDINDIDDFWDWRLIWFIRFDELVKKINEYFIEAWLQITSDDISKNKKTIFSGLSWSPIFYDRKIIGVISIVWLEKSLFLKLVNSVNPQGEFYTPILFPWPDIVNRTILLEKLRP